MSQDIDERNWKSHVGMLYLNAKTHKAKHELFEATKYRLGENITFSKAMRKFTKYSKRIFASDTSSGRGCSDIPEYLIEATLCVCQARYFNQEYMSWSVMSILLQYMGEIDDCGSERVKIFQKKKFWARQIKRRGHLPVESLNRDDNQIRQCDMNLVSKRGLGEVLEFTKANYLHSCIVKVAVEQATHDVRFEHPLVDKFIATACPRPSKVRKRPRAPLHSAIESTPTVESNQLHNNTNPVIQTPGGQSVPLINIDTSVTASCFDAEQLFVGCPSKPFEPIWLKQSGHDERIYFFNSPVRLTTFSTPQSHTDDNNLLVAEISLTDNTHCSDNMSALITTCSLLDRTTTRNPTISPTTIASLFNESATVTSLESECDYVQVLSTPQHKISILQSKKQFGSSAVSLGGSLVDTRRNQLACVFEEVAGQSQKTPRLRKRSALQK